MLSSSTAAASPAESPRLAGVPGGDVVHAFVVSPGFAEDGVCLSARHSGLWRSTDGGATWRPSIGQAGSVPMLAATAVAFSPSFAADRTVFAGVYGAVLRSRDAGETWRAAPLPAPPSLVSCLAVSPAYEEDGVLLAGTVEDGVLRSADRGETWRRWNFGLLDLAVLALAISPAFAADDTLFAGTETGIFVSENGGRSWRETAFPDDAAPVLALAVSPRFAIDGVVWAGTEGAGVWRSADRGRTWQWLDGGAIGDAVNGLTVAPGDPGEGAVLATLPEAIMVSRDEGQTWTAVIAGLGDEGGIATVAAPWGLATGATLLVGLRGGSVRRAVLAG